MTIGFTFTQCSRAVLLTSMFIVCVCSSLGLRAFAESSQDSQKESSRESSQESSQESPSLWQKMKHAAFQPEKSSEKASEDNPAGVKSTETPVKPVNPALSPAEEFRQTYLHKVAVMQTQRGEVVFKLFPNEAPKTVENFASLVKKGFYDVSSMKFHRVVPGFVVQTGDPTGTGYGGSGTPIQLEAKNKLSHDKKGIVAMARGPAPNSGTSQFYITLKPQIKLDGKYAIFGEVIKGLDVLDLIQQDDRVYGIQFVDEAQIQPDQPIKKKSLLHMF